MLNREENSYYGSNETFVFALKTPNELIKDVINLVFPSNNQENNKHLYSCE